MKNCVFLMGLQKKIKKLCQKLKELYQKAFRILAKTQGFEKNLKGIRPYWAYWASIKCSKNKLALDSP